MGAENGVAKMMKNSLKPSSPEKKRLLIVDDDELLLNMFSKLLKKLDFDSDRFTDIDRALNKYRTMASTGARYEAVIMDLNIPGKFSGQETIDRFREINSRIRIIVTSGDNNYPLMEDYLRHGLAGRLLKPFSIGDLKEVLDEILNDAF